MSKKVLITGATGFIGSFLAEEALRKGYEVYAGIRRSSNKQFLQERGIYFVELDFSNPEALKKQLIKLADDDIYFDYVIHSAGITHAKKNESFYTSNFLYTKNFIDALIASAISPDKFILISSLASFGPGDEGFTSIKLSDKKIPVSEYGKSKLLAEEYLLSLTSFPYIIINPTGVYGPRDKGFLEFLKFIKKGWEPYIGRNKQMISLIYVKDLAKAVVSLLSSKAVNRAFIVSDGYEYNKEDLGNTAKALLQKKTIKVKLPVAPVRITVGAIDKVHTFFKGYAPFLNKEKLEELSQANWLCDSCDLWDALQDKPSYNLKAGLQETIEWYQQNKWL